VLFLAFAIHADHAALEVAEKVLDGVCGLAIATNVVAALVPAVIDGLVCGELFANLDVQPAFVGMQF
jgi:hypothetical protein